MLSSSSLARCVLGALLGSLVAGSCGSSDDGGRRMGAGGASTGGTSGSGGAVIISPEVGLAGEGGQGTVEFSPLCGVEACIPDDPRSCAAYVPPIEAEQVVSLGGTGGEGGTIAGGAGGERAGGSSNAAGAGGTLSPGAPATGGTVSGAGAGGVEGGSAGADSSVPAYACHVGGSARRPTAECHPAGLGSRDAPCFTSSDCVAGLACVSDGAVGRCRPFCCRGELACDAHPGTYCANRELLEDPARREPIEVPVCVMADNCDLAKPPCEGSEPCECPRGTACQVVHPGRVTACAPEGTGEKGEPCPCRYGYVCSRASSVCLALCQTAAASAPESACARCQASSELPDGWGVCVD